MAAGLKGKDLSKNKEIWIPESMGSISALLYLLAQFGLILVSRLKFTSFLSALLSIQSMMFLGFADDVLNLKWRYKVFLPALASIPMLFVYAAENGQTAIVVPVMLRGLLGPMLDLGVFYYIYMAMMSIFCTNSINILAGINGIEAGQSLVIALVCILNSLYQYLNTNFETTKEVHLFTLLLLIPFVGVSFGLFLRNKYPAQVFVGDTFTYFAGMVLAVTGILGHFTKTMLLLHFMQILNFLISIPQLFQIVPCPRHRLPKFNKERNIMTPSLVNVKKQDLSLFAKRILKLFFFLGLISLQEKKDEYIFSNFTIINVVLVTLKRFKVDGIHEQTLTNLILVIQFMGCILLLFIRNYLAGFFY